MVYIYETVASIDSRRSYSSAILVNGHSLVDGLSASGLSRAINSLILLTQVDSIPKVMCDKLSHADTIYIVGGTGVVSTSIKNELKRLGKNVVRLGGRDRFKTLSLVENKIEKVKEIQEI